MADELIAAGQPQGVVEQDPSREVEMAVRDLNPEAPTPVARGDHSIGKGDRGSLENLALQTHDGSPVPGEPSQCP